MIAINLCCLDANVEALSHSLSVVFAAHPISPRACGDLCIRTGTSAASKMLVREESELEQHGFSLRLRSF